MNSATSNSVVTTNVINKNANQLGGSTLVILFEKDHMLFDQDLCQNAEASLETLVSMKLKSRLVKSADITFFFGRSRSAVLLGSVAMMTRMWLILELRAIGYLI